MTERVNNYEFHLAQLAGWRLAYHGEVEVPSELPPVLTDFISQQKRWAQGSMQTAVKVLPQLLLARLPLPVKVEALFHLLSGFGWVAAALATLTLWPALIWMGQGASLAWIPGVAVLTGSCGALLLYYVVYCLLERRARLFFRYIPFLPLVCIGVAPFLALSVLKGLVCRQGIFHRTPKYGLQGAAGHAGTTRALKMAWISFCCFGLTFWPVALMPALSPAALPLAAAIPLGYLFTGSLLAREGGAKRRMRSILSLFLSVVGG